MYTFSRLSNILTANQLKEQFSEESNVHHFPWRQCGQSDETCFVFKWGFSLELQHWSQHCQQTLVVTQIVQIVLLTTFSSSLRYSRFVCMIYCYENSRFFISLMCFCHMHCYTNTMHRNVLDFTGAGLHKSVVKSAKPHPWVFHEELDVVSASWATFWWRN